MRTSTKVTASDELLYPVIKDYGGIMQVTDAIGPEKTTKYKMVFDIKSPGNTNSELTPGLTRVASFINACGASGIKPGELSIVAVVHEDAAKAALTTEAYKDNFYVDNPDNRIISELKAAGVQLLVCFQALVKRNFNLLHINKDFDLALNATVTLASHQMHGFGIITV